MIAITFALPAESSGVIALLPEKKNAPCGSTRIIQGKIDNEAVAMFHTGVGKSVCRQRMEDFLQDRQFNLLISTGFAGALREDLNVGDLVLAENFSDPRLLSTARRILDGRKIHVAALFTSNAMIDSPGERNRIAGQQGAVAVDMETETIAQMCRERGIPLLSLRVISDSLHEPFPAPSGVLFDIKRQRTDNRGLSLYLLKHPTAIWRLIRFARQIARAREVLTDAIVELAGKMT